MVQYNKEKLTFRKVTATIAGGLRNTGRTGEI